LESYNFTIEHRSGKQHGNADGLSHTKIGAWVNLSIKELKELSLSSVHNNLAVFSVNLLSGLAMSENEGMNLR
jgi:hypothetical protein